ncbi:MAG: arylsulfatase [Bacteroidota bacterium]
MKNYFFLLLGLLIYACQPSPSDAPVERPPNVVYIIVDDLGTEDLACFGSQNILSPHLDQLARNGLRFTQAYSGCTVCAPARSTLMTGQHMGHTPVRGNTGGISLPKDAYTLGKMFKNAGYATGGFGKWGIAEVGTAGVPEKQGFDRFFGYYHQIHAHRYYPEYLYQNSQRVEMGGLKGDSASYTAYRIAEETKRFIRENKDRPFFCYAPWTVPHGAYVIPPSDPAVQLYADTEWEPNYKNYAAMVSMLDRHVGEVVQLLEELGLAENTLIIFSSDNGGGKEFAPYRTNGDLRGFKRDLYEGGLRVPMIAYWPGTIPAQTETALPVYFPDLMPTFAEVIGATASLPNTIDGQSFYPSLINPAQTIEDRWMYWEYPHYDWGKAEYPATGLKQAVRFGKWKLLRTGTDKPWELYDLSNDPFEQNSLAMQHPALIKEYEAWIVQHRHDPPMQVEPERIDGKKFR